MKFLHPYHFMGATTGRTPRGVRGLKCAMSRTVERIADWSHPSRGAWIEITYKNPEGRLWSVAPLAGCVD